MHSSCTAEERALDQDDACMTLDTLASVGPDYANEFLEVSRFQSLPR
jgi:hypothetical protein